MTSVDSARRTWAVVATSLVIGAIYVLRVLIPAGMDPSIFLALGEETPRQTAYAEGLLGRVVLRAAFGHDGKFFFAQANDPFYLNPDEHAAFLDQPLYRGQRMLFPLLAGGFGLFPPRVVVWAMLGLNLTALILATVVAAKLATLWGASPWLGLSVPLNLGLLSEIDIGGAGVIAMLMSLAAVYAIARQPRGVSTGLLGASLLLSLAALAREVALLFALGLVALYWLRHRVAAWQLVAFPVLGAACWRLYLVCRLSGLPSGEPEQALSAPFLGLWEAFGYWVQDPIDLAIGAVLLAVLAAFALKGIRSENLLAWGALPTIALATILSVRVWREPYDIARAIAPVLIAYPFLLFLPVAKHSPLVLSEQAFD